MLGKTLLAPRTIFLLLLASAATVFAASAVEPPVAELPFVLNQDHVFVTVELEDGDARSLGPVTLILDTGASTTVLGRATLDHLDLPHTPLPAGRVQGAGGMLDAEHINTPLVLRLGDAALEMARPIALDLDRLRRFRGRHIDGVLGADLFRRFVVEIDYAARRLRLHEPAGFEAPDGVRTVPIDVAHPIPVLKATLTTADGRRRVEAPFYLDTGAAASLVVAPAFAAEHDLLAGTEERVEISRHGVATRFKNVLARLGSLELGDAVIERPIAAFPQIGEGFFATTKSAGVIGGSALRRFTVILDYARERMLLLPNGGFDEPDRFVTAGLELAAEGEAFDQLVVKGVIAASPAAESGIRPGDRVIAVAGQDVEELSLPAVLDILSDEGRKVLVRLARDNAIVEAILVPRGLI